MKQQLIISKKHWQEMLEYVKQNAPFEACGLLAGKKGQVEKVLLVRNQAQSAVRCSIAANAVAPNGASFRD